MRKKQTHTGVTILAILLCLSLTANILGGLYLYREKSAAKTATSAAVQAEASEITEAAAPETTQDTSAENGLEEDEIESGQEITMNAPETQDAASETEATESEQPKSESPEETTPEASPESEQPSESPEETSAETTQAVETPAPSEEPDVVAEKIAEMTLSDKIYQMMIVTPEALTGVSVATQAGQTTRNALAQQPVGGLVYFAQNINSREQVTQMLANTQTYAAEEIGIPLYLAVDEEGGTVSRLSGLSGITKIGSMASYGATGDSSAATQIGETLAEELLGLGFNLDFAPVADVLTNPNNTAIGSRSYGSDPSLVAEFVSAQVSAMQENGLIATLKHFPGHGGTTSDTHNGFVSINRTLDELLSCELIPFQAGIDAGAAFVMAAHITDTAIDDVPASLSSTLLTDVLRDTLGFDGVIITDAMNMGAITQNYASGEAAVMAIEAGADIILYASNLQTTHDAILSAVESGRLTEARIDESVYRILKTKLEFGIWTPAS